MDLIANHKQSNEGGVPMQWQNRRPFPKQKPFNTQGDEMANTSGDHDSWTKKKLIFTLCLL